MSRYVSTAPSDVFTSDYYTAFIQATLSYTLASNKNSSVPLSQCAFSNVHNDYIGHIIASWQ